MDTHILWPTPERISLPSLPSDSSHSSWSGVNKALVHSNKLLSLEALLKCQSIFKGKRNSNDLTMRNESWGQEIISQAPEFTYEYPWSKGGWLSKALGMLSWTSDREGRRQAVLLAWSALRTRRKTVENKVPCTKWCQHPLKSPSISVAYVDWHPQTNCKLNSHLRTIMETGVITCQLFHCPILYCLRVVFLLHFFTLYCCGLNPRPWAC